MTRSASTSIAILLGVSGGHITQDGGIIAPGILDYQGGGTGNITNNIVEVLFTEII